MGCARDHTLPQFLLFLNDHLATGLVLRSDAVHLSPYWQDRPVKSFTVWDPHALASFVNAVHRMTAALRSSYVASPEVLSTTYGDSTVYLHLHTPSSYGQSEWRSDILVDCLEDRGSGEGADTALTWQGKGLYRDPDTIILMQQRRTGKFSLVARSRVQEDPVDAMLDAARRQAQVSPSPLLTALEMRSAILERTLLARSLHLRSPEYQWTRQRHARAWMEALAAHPLLRSCESYLANDSKAGSDFTSTPSASSATFPPSSSHILRGFFSSPFNSLWAKIRRPRKSSSLVFPRSSKPSKPEVSSKEFTPIRPGAMITEIPEASE